MKTNDETSSAKSKKKSKSWKSKNKREIVLVKGPKEGRNLFSPANTTEESENDSIIKLDKVVWLEAALNELEILNGTLKLAL